MQILVLLVTFGLCHSQVQLQDEWLTWKMQNSKVYNIREEGSRWNVWRDNFKKIQEHNNANYSFVLGLNEFADMVNSY